MFLERCKFCILILLALTDWTSCQNIPNVDLDLSLQNSGGLDLLEGDISPSIRYVYTNFNSVDGGACQYFDTNIILIEMENRVLVPKSSSVQITNPNIGSNGTFAFTFIAEANKNDNVCLICSFFSADYYPLTTCLNINVKAPPKVELKVKPKEISTGDTVVVTCKFSGYPFPEFEFNPKRIVPYSEFEVVSQPNDKLKIIKYTAVIRKIDASWDGEEIQCLTKPNSDFAGITKIHTLRVFFRERRRNGPWILVLVGIVALLLLVLILLAAGYSISRRKSRCQTTYKCPENPVTSIKCLNTPYQSLDACNTPIGCPPVQHQKCCCPQNCAIDECSKSKMNTQPTLHYNQKHLTYSPPRNGYRVSGSAYV